MVEGMLYLGTIRARQSRVHPANGGTLAFFGQPRAGTRLPDLSWQVSSAARISTMPYLVSAPNFGCTRGPILIPPRVKERRLGRSLC